MKKIFVSFFLFVNLITFSQVITVNVTEFEYLGSIGNVNYQEVLLNPAIRLSVGTDEKFIVNIKESKVTYIVGNYTTTSDIISLDTVNKKVFVIKYNEDPNESSSKIPVVMEINLNRNEKSLKYKTYSKKDNYTIVKSTLKSKMKIN